MAKTQSKAEEYAEKTQPVETAWLDYWIENEPGGSGLSVSLQWRLKSMALELKEARAKK